jgi:hypothetical protein
MKWHNVFENGRQFRAQRRGLRGAERRINKIAVVYQLH